MPLILLCTIKAILEKVKKVLSQKPAVKYEDDFITVKTEQKGKMLKINLPDIDYVEGMKNYVAIHHNNQKTIALLTMAELENRLPAEQFFRVHKSFIVGMRKVAGIDGNIIHLKGYPQSNIWLGQTYRDAFLEELKKNMLGR